MTQRFTYWVEEAEGNIAVVHICTTDSERPIFSFKDGVIDLDDLTFFISRMTLTTPPKQTEERGKA